MWPRKQIWCAAAVVLMTAGCSASVTPPLAKQEYLVFFDDFSAHLSDEARAVIDSAATEAKRRQTKRIRVEASANASGSPDATMKIARTRAAMVRDALVSDGVSDATILLVPLGQMGTTDTSVMMRRTAIILQD
jgi:outer membrane protein OmpA-like peptidoglycan-associated protein